MVYETFFAPNSSIFQKVVQKMEKIATLKRYALQANAVITGQTSLFLTDLYFHKWNGSFDILLKFMS